MAVQYIPTKRQFRITYKDYTRLDAGKSPYISRFFYVVDKDGNKIDKPTAAQRKARALELEELVEQLEAESKKGLTPTSTQNIVDNARRAGIKKKNLLIPLLREAMAKPAYSNSKAIMQQGSTTVRELIEYIEADKPDMTIKELNKPYIIRFINARYTHLMLNTAHNKIKRLRTAYKLLLERHNLTHTNYFLTITTRDLRSALDKDDAIITKELGAFTADAMHNFWKFIDGKNLKAGLRAVFYILLLTGWRVQDCYMLHKDQIDLDANTITLTHGKTKKSTGAKTVIFMTPLLKRLIEEAGSSEDGYIWGGTKDGKESRIRDLFNSYIKKPDNKPKDYIEFIKNGKKQRSHTIHSFRRSVITHLKANGIDSEIVRYITGHSGGTIEEKHYNTFSLDPEKTTGYALAIMENIILNGNKAVEENNLNKLVAYAKTLNISPAVAANTFRAVEQGQGKEKLLLTPKMQAELKAKNARRDRLTKNLVKLLTDNGFTPDDLADLDKATLITAMQVTKEMKEKEVERLTERAQATLRKKKNK